MKKITKMDTLTNTHKCTMDGCKNRGPFKTENLLGQHFKTAHSSVKFGCYRCERIFTDQAILFLHLSLNHSIEVPDKKKIILLDGSKQKLIGFLEVEERIEFVDEANGLLTNSDLGIFPNDLPHHIQVIHSAQIVTYENIDVIDNSAQTDIRTEKVENGDDEVCQNCGLVFGKQAVLKIHNSLMHPKGNKDDQCIGNVRERKIDPLAFESV